MTYQEDEDEDDEKAFVVKIMYNRVDLNINQIKHLADECFCTGCEEFDKTIKLYFEEKEYADSFIFFMNKYVKKSK